MHALKHYVRDIQDFPEAGIVFKDITPLLADAEGLAHCLHNLLALVGAKKIDKVVGIESRGFIFGPLLAKKLDAGFVPVRKPGKLPAEKIVQTYTLEYGEDSLEIHVDAIKPGERVLIHDDVLATGGTAEAVCKLVEQLGGKIVQCNFIIELGFLNGREKLKNHIVKAVIDY